MKTVLRIIVGAILAIALVVYILVIPIVNLTDKDNTHTVRIDGAAELIEVDHSINGLIPMGTEYFYVGINEENLEAYVIKASKKWLEKNFDSEGISLAAGGLEITGLAKKIDYDVEREIYSFLTSVEEVTYPLTASKFLDTSYMTDIIAKLVLFAVLVFLVTAFLIILKKGGSPVFSKILGVLALVWMIVLLVITV